MHPLPYRVAELLAQYDAPPRLVTHLVLVHDVAIALVDALDRHWPGLPYDRQAVLLGAATHDIGKVVHRHELTGPGHQHEDIGPTLLLQAGFTAAQARFARTHGQWRLDADPTVEDLLVALADMVWRGKRDEQLEQLVMQRLAEHCAQEPWAVYAVLDEILQNVTDDAATRLAWLAQQSAE